VTAETSVECLTQLIEDSELLASSTTIDGDDQNEQKGYRENEQMTRFATGSILFDRLGTSTANIQELSEE
jgi:hypothetical protein